MKILITNYTGYRSNWGSQATSRGLIQFLKEIWSHKTELEIDILPYPPTHILDHFHELTQGAVIEKILSKEQPTKREIEIINKLCRSRFGSAINRIQTADLVVFQGEGALGTGREFNRCQIFGPSFLAKYAFDKPIVSINQTISYRDKRDGDKLANIFKIFDQNYARESASLIATQGSNWPKFNLIPDAAFFYKPITTFNYSMDEFKRPYFCITGSANLQSYDLETYCNAISFIAKQKKLMPVFMYSRSSDKKMIDVFRKINTDFEIISSKSHADVDSILPILERAHFVIGGRYHTSISSLSCGTPVILTPSNSKKSKGLQDLIGADNVALLTNPNRDSIQREVDTILSEGLARRTRINQSVRLLNQLSINNSKNLMNLIVNTKNKETSDFIVTEPNPILPTLNVCDLLLRTLSVRRNIKHYDREEFS